MTSTVQTFERIPSAFGKVGTQLWYILGNAFFFLIFSVFYKPFDIVEDLGMGAELFSFNVTMLMCVIIVSILLTRTIMLLGYMWVSRSWWHYLFYCIVELAVISLFFALYLCLMRPGDTLYFVELTDCIKYVFGILIYPYIIITLLVFTGEKLQTPLSSEDAAVLRFCDSNKQLKIAVTKDALLYIKAEENYVRIHYLDQDKVKDYLLRGSMTSIEGMVSRHGIFRCHRSYYVNPGHIKTLRKDKYNQISAELDTAGVVLPVSRTAYPSLSTQI